MLWTLVCVKSSCSFVFVTVVVFMTDAMRCHYVSAVCQKSSQLHNAFKSHRHN